MSTKTSFKRVALVAVASLGLGLMSAVSASAANIISVPTLAITSPSTANSGTTAVPVPADTAIVADLKMITTAVYTDAGDGTDVTYVVTNPSGTVITSSAVFTAVAAPKSGITATASGAVVSVRSTGAGGDMTTAGGTTIATVTLPAAVVNQGGVYTITSSVAAVNATGGTADTDTTGNQMDGTTSLARGKIFVAGSRVTQGITRSNPGAASTGNVAAVTSFLPIRTAADKFRIISTGVGSITAAAQGVGTTTGVAVSATSGTAGNWSSGVNYTSNSADVNQESIVIEAASAVAGDQIITTYAINGTSGVLTAVSKATITWGAAPAVSTQYSLVKLLTGAVSTDVTSSTADTTATVVSSAAGTQRFTIEVETNDQNNAAITGLTLGASIAGPGLIGIANARNATTATGRSLTVALTNEYGSVSVWGDGAAGVGTVTITATNSAGVSTILGTKSVTFVGSPAKASVTQNLYVAKAGTQLGATPTTTLGAATSVATTAAFTAKVVDSAGIPVVAGSTVKMTSSNTAVITGGSCAELTVDGDATATVTPTPGVFECSVSGGTAAVSGTSATITFSVLNATTGLYDIVAAPITFKVGGSIATVTVATDKATYAPGAAINMIATAKDSAGNAAYDGQKPYITANPTANMTTGGSLPTYTTAEIVNGVHSTTGTSASLFAPASTGDLTISGTAANTVAAGVAFTASAKIVSSVDAQIASLLSKINALAKLIAKIQKKLGVK